jgi:hypothetical protein
MYATGALVLLVSLAAPPALGAQLDSSRASSGTWSGGGIQVLTFGETRMPLLAYHAGQRVGHFVLPDITVAALLLPFPYLITIDPHVGVSTQSDGNTVDVALTAGPSIIAPLFGSAGFVYGVGVQASLSVRTDDGHVVRFDAGPRFYRADGYAWDGGSRPVWFLGISFLGAPGRGRSCGCEP